MSVAGRRKAVENAVVALSFAAKKGGLEHASIEERRAINDAIEASRAALDAMPTLRPVSSPA